MQIFFFLSNDPGASYEDVLITLSEPPHNLQEESITCEATFIVHHLKSDPSLCQSPFVYALERKKGHHRGFFQYIPISGKGDHHPHFTRIDPFTFPIALLPLLQQ
eukprot:TRINITY_DN3349_c0_g1_i19.p3 TRINITY_DN3349_c0_g1~~TRINITY_DN3349_c0_g1_i19.p3  ORF type:complete len:105 (-),score=15.68 TRINITY_DN3349_c0_g1_i19:323-637(-)